MAINHTTTSAAITGYTTQFSVASTANMTAPTFQSFVQGATSTYTYLYVEQELMFVTAIPVSGTVQVLRGQMGTQAVAHVSGSLVIIGLPSDFSLFVPKIGAFQTQPDKYQGISAPVAAATTITATGPVFHVTGATQSQVMNPYSGFVEGNITVIADTAWSWSASATTYGFATSGTATTYPGVVTFTYDANTTYWYPSRLA